MINHAHNISHIPLRTQCPCVNWLYDKFSGPLNPHWRLVSGMCAHWTKASKILIKHTVCTPDLCGSQVRVGCGWWNGGDGSRASLYSCLCECSCSNVLSSLSWQLSGQWQQGGWLVHCLVSLWICKDSQNCLHWALLLLGVGSWLNMLDTVRTYNTPPLHQYTSFTTTGSGRRPRQQLCPPPRFTSAVNSSSTAGSTPYCRGRFGGGVWGCWYQALGESEI